MDGNGSDSGPNPSPRHSIISDFKSVNPIQPITPEFHSNFPHVSQIHIQRNENHFHFLEEKKTQIKIKHNDYFINKFLFESKHSYGDLRIWF